jgi:hypothetical protein
VRRAALAAVSGRWRRDARCPASAGVLTFRSIARTLHRKTRRTFRVQRADRMAVGERHTRTACLTYSGIISPSVTPALPKI